MLLTLLHLLTNSMVGMAPTDQLQQFLVRAVTGYGERIQANEVSESELNDKTFKMNTMAGTRVVVMIVVVVAHVADVIVVIVMKVVVK